jgi:hypothetical protein
MSELLEITQPAYSRMEKGTKTNLTIDHLNTLVDTYGVNPWFLLNGTEPLFTDDGGLPILESACYLVPVAAQAGYAGGGDQQGAGLPRVVLPGISGTDDTRVFEAAGD